MKLVLFLCILFFIFINYKYRSFKNPYTLNMVFGKKGSGKTSYFIKLALFYHKRGFNVYSNIPDISFDWLRSFDVSDLGKFVPPPNSVLLIDEAGSVFDNRQFKSFSSDTRDFFKLQRHYKCIVYLASQSYDIDKKLRDLTDNMILCQSFLPWLAIRRPIKRTITLTEASSFGESRIADNLKFRCIFSWRFTFLPIYSKYYNSFHVPEKPALPYK